MQERRARPSSDLYLTLHLCRCLRACRLCLRGTPTKSPSESKCFTSSFSLSWTSDRPQRGAIIHLIHVFGHVGGRGDSVSLFWGGVLVGWFSFQVGDLVLIILDERHDNYVLFTVGPTLYFLHSESLAALDLKPGEPPPPPDGARDAVPRVFICGLPSLLLSLGDIEATVGPRKGDGEGILPSQKGSGEFARSFRGAVRRCRDALLTPLCTFVPVRLRTGSRFLWGQSSTE